MPWETLDTCPEPWQVSMRRSLSALALQIWGQGFCARGLPVPWPLLSTSQQHPHKMSLRIALCPQGRVPRPRTLLGRQGPACSGKGLPPPASPSSPHTCRLWGQTLLPLP